LAREHSRVICSELLTFTGDTSQTQNLERSTLLADHTFVKAQRNNGHPAATYLLVGNQTCNN
jgi:hypothetical protein